METLHEQQMIRSKNFQFRRQIQLNKFPVCHYFYDRLLLSGSWHKTFAHYEGFIAMDSGENTLVHSYLNDSPDINLRETFMLGSFYGDMEKICDR